MSDGRPTPTAIVAELSRFRIRYGSERQMQDDVERVLTAADIEFVREARLGEAGVIDFLVDGRIGIECKTSGGYAPVLQQLIRYADCPQIESLILVTSRRTHRYQLTQLMDKTFLTHWVAACL